MAYMFDMEKEQAIDVVITWVDGADPVHRKKREEYRENKIKFDDIDGETRFISVGEIAYCIASINRFAPFVRKIFIVTDNQDPGINGKLKDYLSDNFNRIIPMEIVSHETIFKGYEQYLPTFNSISIETMLFRIPGLAEHFVYFNDDVVLINKTSPETFFENGKAIAYGYWHTKWTAALLRAIRKKKNGHKSFTLRDSILNSANLVGLKSKFFRHRHTPHAMSRSILEEIYNTYPNLLEENIRFRFRDGSQFNPQALFQNYALPKAKAEEKPLDGLVFYIRPRKEENYIQENLSKCDAMQNATFLCMNSVDMMKPEDRQMLLSWLSKKIGLNKPYLA